MRRWCLALLVAVVALVLVLPAQDHLNAQQNPRVTGRLPPIKPVPFDNEPATTLEQALNSRAFVMTDYYPLGEIQSEPGMGTTTMNCEATVVSSPVSRRAVAKGLRITITDRAEPSYVETSFVDEDELSDLSSAIDSMSTMSPLSTANPAATDGSAVGRREVTFTTKGRFRVGFAESARGRRAVFTAGYLDPLYVSVAVTRLAEFKAKVTVAMVTLAGR